jgi:NADPH:quinone reductase-like Zn-dependent oxidoreductase
MAASRVVPMKTTQMKVVQVPAPGADFQIIERGIPEPTAGQVRIKVQACGVCHSDVLTKDGSWPGIEYPRVPGHEIAGIVDEVGDGVSEWKKGQRVGMAAMTAPVASAGAEILATAKMRWFAASAMTADISNTWWLPLRLW